VNHDLAALRWLLTSPPLLADAAASGEARIQRFNAAQIAIIEAWLSELEAAPQALTTLNAHMAQARAAVRGVLPEQDLHQRSDPLRLGRMAERLLEFFLIHGPLHRLAAANVPLRHSAPALDRTTAGEIDFLLHNSQCQPLHWELAVKYFLCEATGPIARPQDFIGPDRAETFDHKLDKLFKRQLAHAAPEPFQSEHWQPEAFARGWMFYRHGHEIPPCAELALDHLKGWWLPLDEVPALPTRHRYKELPRSQWMPPASSANVQDLLAPEALAQTLAARWQHQVQAKPTPHAFARVQRAQAAASKPSARLVVALSQSSEGSWQEQARYFVLPPEAGQATPKV
jgi:uncharacterized protein